MTKTFEQKLEIEIRRVRKDHEMAEWEVQFSAFLSNAFETLQADRAARKAALQN